MITYRKKIQLLLIVLLGIVTSCATLNKSEVYNAKPTEMGNLCLVPHIDIYNEHIDIVRKTRNREGINDDAGENTPYCSAGFYLGNGLFFDLNGNVSLLILDAAAWVSSRQFTVRKIDYQKIFDKETLMQKEATSYSTKVEKGVGFSSWVQIQQADSLIELSKGKIGRKSLILKPNGDYEYRQMLGKKKIKKVKTGYTIKSLLNTENYNLKSDYVSLNNQIIVKKHNEIIKIYKRIWGSDKLIFEMKRINNSIYIYNSKMAGYKIVIGKRKINVYENQKLALSYEKTL